MPKEANFSNIYKVYDLVNTVLTLGFDKSWRTKASKYIIGNNVLDLGSGTGATYKQLENFNVIAIDPDEKMLQLNKFSKKLLQMQKIYHWMIIQLIQSIVHLFGET